MEPGGWVNRFTPNSDLEVEVGSGRLPGRTNRADRLAALDRLSRRDVHRRKVTVAGRVAAAVIDENVVPVTSVPLRHDDGAAGRGRNGGSHRRRDVETLVKLRRASERIRAPTEG